MITKAEIVKLVEEKIEGTEYYIVDISVSSSNQIRVEIDGDKGVKINDCVQISRHIEGNYDREEVDFELTVSSAGMDQPFKILRQYQRYVDREVEMKTTQGDKIKGILVSADDKAVVLEVTRKEKIEGKKKKQIVIENKTVPMEQVKETKVVISFK
ncbi:ribosome assembly cofactor RimP [Vicingaceae bacterium]|nr:ribosome assembly cofactor RimP [Vicingaceae bacterium]MDB9963739.1 ribosome assembly cofactor RimP [Vicingaceae bacterium]MDC0004755.1 ribosome assembly cofactor RimP [bacterium]MDC1450918.1 ribosome assembly cofactor RimP [Vicingaceae bacterium]